MPRWCSAGTQFPRKFRDRALRNILPEDLKKLPRLEELYRQAVRARWLPDSEANFRNFICAALRATRAGGRVGAIFVGIVKRGLWHHITYDQERDALALLDATENRGRAPKRDELPLSAQIRLPRAQRIWSQLCLTGADCGECRFLEQESHFQTVLRFVFSSSHSSCRRGLIGTLSSCVYCSNDLKHLSAHRCPRLKR